MIRLSVSEAKANLPRYLRRVESGETILLCRRNTPVAEIRPLPGPRRLPRPIGLFEGRLTVPAEFFEPLPEDVLTAFQGGELSPPEPEFNGTQEGPAQEKP